ncbi:tolloid-like protein 1 [Stylophora pistillata]|uniref:Cubilin n=1 Tax=Stylophora pistillata TaxID=50429 RepID=A0A2B4RJJ1_STYPI|nr:tolloid-like protein 1 [Stylophora pistillata]PFX16527.1 Cubilin [Stylophora pistillata]
MMVSKSSQLVTAVFSIVLAVFLKNGQCDSTCPNGMKNITATSGSFKYPESGTYGKNETKCWSITVPDTYVGISYRHLSLDIEVCSGCGCDYVLFSSSYYNIKQQRKSCGRRSYNYLQGYLNTWVSSPGSTLYFRFVSDDTVHYKGLNFTFIATSWASGEENFLNATEDETIEFGTPKVGVKNYPSYYAEQWLLIVPKGRQVQIDFDIFELEDSEDCKHDYVEFREADDPTTTSGVNGAILTNRLCGNSKPSSIQSQGNMVWVQFRSDGNSSTVYKGFRASFKAGQGKFSASYPLTLLFLSALIVEKVNLL